MKRLNTYRYAAKRVGDEGKSRLILRAYKRANVFWLLTRHNFSLSRHKSWNLDPVKLQYMYYLYYITASSNLMYTK